MPYVLYDIARKTWGSLSPGKRFFSVLKHPERSYRGVNTFFIPPPLEPVGCGESSGTEKLV